MSTQPGHQLWVCAVCTSTQSVSKQTKHHATQWLLFTFLVVCWCLINGNGDCLLTYRSNFVAHPLTARFLAVLKHFYFLSFIPSDIVFHSLHFSLAIFIVRRPWTSDGGAIANDWLIDWLIDLVYSVTKEEEFRRRREAMVAQQRREAVNVLRRLDEMRRSQPRLTNGDIVSTPCSIVTAVSHLGPPVLAGTLIKSIGAEVYSPHVLADGK